LPWMERPTIRIRVEYSAVLHLPGLPNRGAVELEVGSTVGQLLDRSGLAGDKTRFVVAVVNGARRRLHEVLENGDQVVLRLPVGGG
jgi:sulfur carrier protein ThiS